MASQNHARLQGVSALVHPVVVLNISDQWTRVRVQNDESKMVVGALLGKQAGRNIEIWNSFELKSSFIDVDGRQQLLIDEEYFEQRNMLYKETFADLEFLGFYVTGDHETTTAEDVFLQRQAWHHNESPFLLKFNALSPVVSDKVAIAVFDSSADPTDENRLLFQSIPVKIVSEIAEQIGLDHVARYSKMSASAESTASKQMGAQFSAINTFLRGIDIARSYVKAVQAGEIERDELILREIQKLCFKLSIHSTKPREQCERDSLQTADHKLLVLLSAFCSLQGAMYQLVEKVNTLARDTIHKERSSFPLNFISAMADGSRALPPLAGSGHLSRFFF